MTTKTETVHFNQDFIGNILKNWRVQELAADPATTYPRIIKNTVSDTYRLWVGPTGADWVDIGTGASVPGADSILNSMLNNMPANTVKANITGGADNPTDVTLANFKTWLALVKGDVGLGNVTNDAQLKVADLDNDPTLAANSATKIPSQQAVLAKINALLAASDAFVYKGTIDCSANPNYPAADAGWSYRVSVAGRIGGGAGPKVQVGDKIECLVDGSAAGTHAAVGANWNIIQANIDGAVVGPAAAVDGDFARFDGATGVLIKSTTVAQTKTDLGITGTEVHKVAATIGDGATADIDVIHNFNTKDVEAVFRNVATDEPERVFWVPTTVNKITAYFPTPPANNEFRCVVFG